MAKRTLNLGMIPDDRTGDKLREAFISVEENTSELFKFLGGNNLTKLGARESLGVLSIEEAEQVAKLESEKAFSDAKSYVENSARFKDQRISSGTDLNLMVTVGTYICRNNADATLNLNYPIAQAGSLIVSRYANDGAVYQEYLSTSGRKYLRAKTGSIWGVWFKQSNSADIESAIQPVPLLTTQSLDDVKTTGKYIARFDTTASFEMKYPVKAPGVLDVTNNPGDSTVYQTFESLNHVVYKRTFTSNEWGKWGVLNELDSAFYQLFTSEVVAYDFNDLKSFVPSKINSSLSRVYTIKGSDYLIPFVSNADCIAKYSNGKISLTGRSDTINNRLSSSKPLLSLSSTLAFSFKYTRSDAQLNVIWQHAPSVAGRLQINVNAVYNGTSLTNSPNSFQVFLHGATQGSGSGGNIKNKMLSTDVLNRVILSIAPGPKASKLFINGELIDTFTVVAIANVNTQVLGFIGGSTQNVEISKILAVQEVITEEQISEIDFWLGKSESSNSDEDNDILKDLALLSSKAAAAAIIPENGIYNSDLLLYSQNETHIGLQASLTKIITSVVLLDLASDLNQMIIRTEDDASGGSGSNLNIGDSISIYSALRNLMLPSSNVTAKIIARVFGGQLLNTEGMSTFTTDEAIARWVVELNTKAQLIGMSETVFASPDGLDTSSSSLAKTTALDCVKLTCYASRYKDLMKAWSEPTYAMSITNSGVTRTVNIATTVVPLSSGDEYVYGGKTGTLNRYGYNVAEVAVLPDGRKVALVTLGASSDADRTADIRTVMNATATKFDWSSRPRKTA